MIIVVTIFKANWVIIDFPELWQPCILCNHIKNKFILKNTFLLTHVNIKFLHPMKYLNLNPFTSYSFLFFCQKKNNKTSNLFN